MSFRAFRPGSKHKIAVFAKFPDLPLRPLGKRSPDRQSLRDTLYVDEITGQKDLPSAFHPAGAGGLHCLTPALRAAIRGALPSVP
jgi:hypothetical protein